MFDGKLEPRLCGYKYWASLPDPRFFSSHKHKLRHAPGPRSSSSSNLLNCSILLCTMAELSEQQFKALLSEVVGADVSASPPITDRRWLAGLEKSLRNIAVRLRSGNPIRIAKNSATEWEDVKKWLWGVGNLEVVTKDY